MAFPTSSNAHLPSPDSRVDTQSATRVEPGASQSCCVTHEGKRGLVLTLLGLALLGCIAFMVFRRPSARAAASVVPTPTQVGIGLRGWHATLPGTDAASQVGGFAGSYASGEVLYLPPSAAFTLRAEPASATGHLQAPGEWLAGGGSNLDATLNRAPEHPGLYRLTWSGTESATLNVLVLQRATLKARGERTSLIVHGKDLGAYLDPAKSNVERVQEHAAHYRPPEFFAELDPQTLKLPVGESLALGQFVAFIERRDAEGHKIYTTQRHTDVLPPSRPLCEKLSRLIERLHQKGVRVSRFWITSGFRTPEYNRSIGGAAYSRHCFGDAVDLVIDEDGDKRMDDLNGDKRLDKNDGLVIGRTCLELEREGLVVPGGIGVYEWDSDDSVRSHVHVDCRGYPVRWGQISRGARKISFDWWTELGDTASEAAPE
jgi:hypothetical protein